MKWIKRIGLGVLGFVSAILVIAAFVPKEMKALKTVVIQQPKSLVYSYVVLLKNQENYSKWATMDKDMTKSFRGSDGTVGFVSAWESKNEEVGKGEQEITAIQPGTRIDYALRFMEPFESKATSYMQLEEVNATTTKVTWGFESEMAYPMNIMKLFVDMDEMIGADFQYGLDKLKTILEK